MLNTNDAARVMDTILSTPGMSEAVKIDFKIPRKNILLLCSVIERGLASKEEGQLEAEDKKSLEDFTAECLQKAGLTELHEKLKALSSKGA